MRINDLLDESIIIPDDSSDPIIHRPDVITEKQLSSLIFLGSSSKSGIEYQYYFDIEAKTSIFKRCMVLINGQSFRTILEKSGYEKFQNKSLNKIQNNAYYSVSSIEFYRDRDATYDKIFKSLVDPQRVHQVKHVATMEILHGLQLGLSMYIEMASKGYIICSDKYQTENGKGLWQSLMKYSTANTKSGSGASFTNPGIYSSYLLTSSGFVTRDVDQSQVKPVHKGVGKRGTFQTVPSELIWTPEKKDNNQEKFGSTLLFFGKTEVLNLYITKSHVPMINYSSMKQKQTQSHHVLNIAEIAKIRDVIIEYPNILYDLKDILAPSPYSEQIKNFIFNSLSNIKTYSQISELARSGKFDEFIKVGAFDYTKMMKLAQNAQQRSQKIQRPVSTYSDSDSQNLVQQRTPLGPA
jgi:hypothetical protein